MARVQLNFICKKCKEPVVVKQSDPEDLGTIQLRSCKPCMKTKMLEILDLRKSELLDVYTDLENDINNIYPDES